MPDNMDAKAKQIFDQFTTTFANLLKEFPKNPAEDFIYDGSTLKKISHAANAWTDITTLLKQRPDSLEENHRARIDKSFKTFNQLMEELPRDPADEFLYDRVIHQLVVKARETIDQLRA
jgi:hypothetical protein